MYQIFIIDCTPLLYYLFEYFCNVEGSQYVSKLCCRLRLWQRYCQEWYQKCCRLKGLFDARVLMLKWMFWLEVYCWDPVSELAVYVLSDKPQSEDEDEGRSGRSIGDSLFKEFFVFLGWLVNGEFICFTACLEITLDSGGRFWSEPRLGPFFFFMWILHFLLCDMGKVPTEGSWNCTVQICLG